MNAFDSLVALSLCFAIGCGSEPLASSDLAMSADPVVDGVLATTCQWPTALRIGGCSATLVHPKLVTLAAHCLEGPDLPNEVLFGEDETRPERRVLIETCKGYPDYVLAKSDVAYCTLVEAVHDVPRTPILMGCETAILKPGNGLTLVGFGFANEDGAWTSGKKRWADVVIRRMGDFSIEIGLGTATSCLGDSGGPLYAKLFDGTFRAVSAASLTHLVDGECAAPSYHIQLHKFVAWLETSSGLDVTPCHDADGTWNPGPDCGGFATAADRSNGTWLDGCSAGATSAAGATCRQGGDDSGSPTDAGTPPPPESEPGHPQGCACGLGSGRKGRSHEAWTSFLVLGSIGLMRRRVRASR